MCQANGNTNSISFPGRPSVSVECELWRELALALTEVVSVCHNSNFFFPLEKKIKLLQIAATFAFTQPSDSVCFKLFMKKSTVKQCCCLPVKTDYYLYFLATVN